MKDGFTDESRSSFWYEGNFYETILTIDEEPDFDDEEKKIIIFTDNKHDENGDLNMYINRLYIEGGTIDLVEIEDPQEYADAESVLDRFEQLLREGKTPEEARDRAQEFLDSTALGQGNKEKKKSPPPLMSDSSFCNIDDLFYYTLSIHKDPTLHIDDTVADDCDEDEMFSPKQALHGISVRQLIRNRCDDSAEYHIQIRSLGSAYAPSLAQTLSKVYSGIGRHAWSEGVLNNLPYIINCRSRSVLEAIAKVIEDVGGETAEISDDKYYAAADLFDMSEENDGIFEGTTQAFLKVNKALRNFYRQHISITASANYAQTARELTEVIPDWDMYTLRRVLRDMLPYTIHCENHAQAVMAVEVIERNGGKAELESDDTN